MNVIHAHLVLNHLPLIAIPLSLLFLAVAYLKDQRPIEKLAYLLIFIAAASVLPIFLTGEASEDLVESIPSISESTVEVHEEAAKLTVPLAATLALFSFMAIFLANNISRRKFFVTAVFFISIALIGALLYTANLGGKIRHPEISLNEVL